MKKSLKLIILCLLFQFKMNGMLVGNAVPELIAGAGIRITQAEKAINDILVNLKNTLVGKDEHGKDYAGIIDGLQNKLFDKNNPGSIYAVADNVFKGIKEDIIGKPKDGEAPKSIAQGLTEVINITINNIKEALIGQPGNEEGAVANTLKNTIEIVINNTLNSVKEAFIGKPKDGEEPKGIAQGLTEAIDTNLKNTKERLHEFLEGLKPGARNAFLGIYGLSVIPYSVKRYIKNPENLKRILQANFAGGAIVGTLAYLLFRKKAQQRANPAA